MNEVIKSERTLGLPPMELAEPTSSNRDRRSSSVHKCVSPWIKNVFGTIILVAIAVGLYVIFVRILQTTSNNKGATEIIIVTGSRGTPNITVKQADMDILLQLKNNSSQPALRRKRRQASLKPPKKRELDDTINEPLSEDIEFKKARDIVINHEAPCNSDIQDEVCKDIVTKLRTIKQDSSQGSMEKLSTEEQEVHKSEKSLQSPFHDNLPKESSSSHEEYNTHHHSSHYLDKDARYQYQYAAAIPQVGPITPHLADTCLLARLLKDNPHVQGVYGVPGPSYLSPLPVPSPYQPTYPNYPSYPSYHSQVHSAYPHNRQAMSDLQRPSPHPQDLEIFRLLQLPLLPKTTPPPFTQTSRETECPMGTTSCDDGEGCILQKQWCDGEVHCADVSDEAKCSCKSRVDKSRLCDGYFDCPFGDDEMGCFGCGEDSFSCGDVDLNSRSSCFSKEQRCNNIVDCPNSRDEVECNLLSSTFHDKPIFAVSNTEGLLQRNFKGNWYPVCNNPYMWAHDACRRETGLMIRPPFIQLVQIDPAVKVSYINTSPSGSILMSDTCGNSSAVYVTCPDLLCGTRVPTAPQSLRENAAFENHLFGRNKRYHLQRNSPYTVMFIGNRKRRDILSDNNNKETKILMPPRVTQEKEMQRSAELERVTREKEVQSRVVGGKPSEPAAWPWMVALYRDGMFHCGGVIITQKWIVSAAHCVSKFWEHYYEVQVGMLRRFSFSPQEQNHRVTHVIVNQNYDRQDMKNDLSLVRVKPAIQFSRWVRPICLPSPETAGPDWLNGPAPGTTCIAVGWGATVEGGPDPDHLREVEVPIWANCKHSEDRAGKEICAGMVEGGKDACQGDSGGPLLCRNPLNFQQWYVAGIVSHGDGCGRKSEPGVYTRLSLFNKWIKFNIFSKSLPNIRPKQECPGFKCSSGISKCLPKKRICDKIVDCLDSEDEMNCNLMRSVMQQHDNNFAAEIIPDNLPGTENLFKARESNKTSNINENTESSDSEAQPLSSTPPVRRSTNFVNTDQNTNTKIGITEGYDDGSKTTKIVKAKNKDRLKLQTLKQRIGSASSEVILESSDEPFTADPFDVTVTDKISTIEHIRGDVQGDVVSSTEIVDFGILDKDADLTTTQPKELQQTQSDNIIDIHNEKNISTELESTTIFTNHRNEKQESEEHVNQDNNETLDDLPLTTNEPDANNFNHNKDKEQSTEKSKLDTKKNSVDLLTSETQVATVTSNHTQKQSDSENNLSTKADTDTKVEKRNEILTLLQARTKKKHHVPQHFSCRRISQKLLYHQRCDHKADCEDGTDELGCSCVDYLSIFDEKLICDGIVDCADGSDETDCYGCGDDHFLCHRSKTCLPLAGVCDGRPQCPNGEDEFDCYALSNGKNIIIEMDGTPKTFLEGFITKKSKDNWNIFCEDNLTVEQQEIAASHICRYLGFSAANRYLVKYVNIQPEDLKKTSDEDTRFRREVLKVPIHFTYKSASEEENTAREVVIKNPEIIKEQCVPNITKTCMSIYVFCEPNLFNSQLLDLDTNQELTIFSRSEGRTWPWIAKVFVEGDYKCTGILVDLSWVLISHYCLWDSLLVRHYVSVTLGVSQRTLRATTGPFEQTLQVDAKIELYHDKLTLLHLKQPAQYSNMVKPMAIPTNNEEEKAAICVAIGQDENNSTITVFLEETLENCASNNRCFVRHTLAKDSVCASGMVSNRPWSGIISCHRKRGWHPAATFVEAKGECGVEDRIVGVGIENLKDEIKKYFGKEKQLSESKEQGTVDFCNGERCGRGKCVQLNDVCDGVRHCEDGNDESETACEKKDLICTEDPYHRGCECKTSQLKCRNGRCVSKKRFGDGRDDCGDGSDEPGKVTCAQYLARVMPLRLCDGVLHCHDKTDEDPVFCKCFSKKSYKCGGSDHCVAPDMVCDGAPDCPGGEDELSCVGLSAPEGTTYGTGELIVRSHGVWHSKCYTRENHTRTELEEICRELGFISGHAKQLRPPSTWVLNPRTKVLLDPFTEVTLNNNTSIMLRNSDQPLAKPVVDEKKDVCFPVFIECV